MARVKDQTTDCHAVKTHPVPLNFKVSSLGELPRTPSARSSRTSRIWVIWGMEPLPAPPTMGGLGVRGRERFGPKEAAGGQRALRARHLARGGAARGRRQEDSPLPGVRQVRPGSPERAGGAGGAARRAAAVLRSNGLGTPSARPRSDGACPQGGVILAEGIIWFLCTLPAKRPCLLHKKAARRRTRAALTSENRSSASLGTGPEGLGAQRSVILAAGIMCRPRRTTATAARAIGPGENGRGRSPEGPRPERALRPSCSYLRHPSSRGLRCPRGRVLVFPQSST